MSAIPMSSTGHLPIITSHSVADASPRWLITSGKTAIAPSASSMNANAPKVNRSDTALSWMKPRFSFSP